MADEEGKSKFVPPLARAQLVCELLSFFAFCILTLGQLGLLDYYFVLYGGDNLWLLWIIADCVVLGASVWVFYYAISYSRRCLNVPCKDEANLKYAFIVWLIYSLVLSAKLATFFPMFSPQMTPGDASSGANEKIMEWGPIRMKFVLAMSAAIFLFLVLSHHYNRLNNPRALYLSYLSSVISIDLLDSVLFLEILVEPTLAVHLKEQHGFKIAIVVFACINFVLPTFALFKLRYKKGLPSWVPLPYEKLYSLIYFLLVNVPFLVIRAHLWRKKDHDVSIFLFKNAIMIAVGVRDVWVGFLLWREKKALKAHKAAGGHDPYENGDNTSADRLRCTGQQAV